MFTWLININNNDTNNINNNNNINNTYHISNNNNDNNFIPQNKLQIRDKKIDKKSLFTKFKMIAWIVQ